MTSLQEQFGELRSKLNMSHTRATRNAFWDFLQRARAKAPEQYDNEWVPYMVAHAHLLPVPFQTVCSIEDVDELNRLLPAALFSLSLTHHNKDHGHALKQVWSRIVNSPRLEYICAISLYNVPIELKHLTQLLNSPKLTNLRTLDLGQQHNTFSLLPITNSTQLKMLRTLNLQGNYNLNSRDIQTLAYTNALPSLEVLILDGCHVSQETITALKQSNTLPNLHTIHTTTY